MLPTFMMKKCSNPMKCTIVMTKRSVKLRIDGRNPKDPIRDSVALWKPVIPMHE
jgi:hypothetical protein